MKKNNKFYCLRILDKNNFCKYKYEYPFNDALSAEVAKKQALRDAIDHYQDHGAHSIDLCTCDKYLLDVTENGTYQRRTITLEDCKKELDNFNVYEFISSNGDILLEILPDCSHNPSLKKKIKEIRRKGECIDWKKQDSNLEWDNNPWWYFHGKLAIAVGYDKGHVINATKSNVSRISLFCNLVTNDTAKVWEGTQVNKMHLNGIVPCKVIGIEGDCIGFFWTTNEKSVVLAGTEQHIDYWDQRGLVVLKRDITAMEDAFYKYLLKADML